MPILLDGCTTWTLTKRQEKKLVGNCTRMLPTSYIEQILEETPKRNNRCMVTYLPSLKPSKEGEQDMRDTAGDASMNSCDVLQWTPTHGRASVAVLVDE